MKLIIDEEYDDLTVKSILHDKLKLSRSQIIALKNDDKGILVNGARVTVRCVVRTGDILELLLEDREVDVNETIEPVELPVDILYEDDNIVVCNKPSGMPTHPSHNHHYDTLANALCYYYKSRNVPFVFRAVNRLDSETSGVVLVAKNRRAASFLGEEMKKRRMNKNYYALLSSVPSQKEGIIENYIARREDSIIFRCVKKEGSDSEYALTSYRVLNVSQGKALVIAHPHTGRTHQLRVHFAHIGCPIVGDGLYGEPGDRLMLHASSLSFCLPFEEDNVSVNAPIPVEFHKYIDLGEK